MLLTIDIGNSHITMGSYIGQELQFVSRLATDRKRTDDQYAIELRDIFHLYQVSPQQIDGAIISSVVPELTSALRTAIRKLTGIRPLLLGPGVKTGLNIKIDNPAQLGSDLVASAVAAIHHHPMPCVVFDLGTATTVSIIDRNGCFIGAVIVAGVGISIDALASRTSVLPHISIEAPHHVIGTNSSESMRAGAVFGTAAMLDGLADRIEEELGEEAALVATGGIAKEIIPQCRRKVECSDNLLLEGLRIIYELNKKD